MRTLEKKSFISFKKESYIAGYTFIALPIIGLLLFTFIPLVFSLYVTVNEYDFFTGYCVKGSETEAFLRDKLPELGLNDAETNEFLRFWLPDMENNPYNIISFQDKTYQRGAKLTVNPAPDTMIRVFMAWYPSDSYVKINPQMLDTPSRQGFTVVEWGGNRVN